MTQNLTPKQEAFCQQYIETGNASEAYRLSYDTDEMLAKTVWEEASRTLNDRKVAARIAELREMHAERHFVTVDSLTRELDEDRQLARELGQPSAAITAVMGKAKLHGHLVDKAEIKADVDLNAKVTIYMPDKGRDENQNK